MHNIFLIRHGESEANILNSILKEKPDCAINLTQNGKLQAEKSSNMFFSYLKENYSSKKLHIKLIHSSYNRAAQTATPFIEKLKELKNISKFEISSSDSLVEINFGLYSGLDPYTEYEKYFPKYYEYWKTQIKDDNGYFFAPKPSGESYWDVCNRIQFDVYKIQNFVNCNNDDFDIVNIAIVIAHGGINRCFAKVCLEKDVSWFKTLNNPENCEIWGINNFNKDFDKKIISP